MHFDHLVLPGVTLTKKIKTYNYLWPVPNQPIHHNSFLKAIAPAEKAHCKLNEYNENSIV